MIQQSFHKLFLYIINNNNNYNNNHLQHHDNKNTQPPGQDFKILFMHKRAPSLFLYVLPIVLILRILLFYLSKLTTLPWYFHSPSHPNHHGIPHQPPLYPSPPQLLTVTAQLSPPRTPPSLKIVKINPSIILKIIMTAPTTTTTMTMMMLIASLDKTSSLYCATTGYLTRTQCHSSTSAAMVLVFPPSHHT